MSNARQIFSTLTFFVFLLPFNAIIKILEVFNLHSITIKYAGLKKFSSKLFFLFQIDGDYLKGVEC